MLLEQSNTNSRLSSYNMLKAHKHSTRSHLAIGQKQLTTDASEVDLEVLRCFHSMTYESLSDLTHNALGSIPPIQLLSVHESKTKALVRENAFHTSPGRHDLVFDTMTCSQ